VRIGEASDASGVPERMIRYYEKLGLIPSALRSGAGYRQYGEDDVHRLKFIALARSVGIPFDDIAELATALSEPRRAREAAERLDKWIDDKSQALHDLRAIVVVAIRKSVAEEA
jgi:MerR family transcriptional regulator, copper efflux regulator